jgi:prolyl 4-hydroxylase
VEHEIAKQDVIKYITNPLNAFLLIKRATADVDLIVKRFPEESKIFVENFKDIQPEAEDLTGAVEGLFRLQQTYRLTSEDLANGIIDGSKVHAALSPHDLFVIGEEATKLKEYKRFSYEYWKLADALLKEGKDFDNEVDKNLNFEEFSSAPDPFNETFVKNGEYEVYKEQIRYRQLCRGDIGKSHKEQSQLYCRFWSKSPFSRLARFKVEEANLEPYIILVLDVISADEIDFLKEKSKPKTIRATTVDTDAKSKASSYRVAQFTWFERDEHEIFDKLARRTEVI